MLFYIVLRYFINKDGQASHSEQPFDDQIQAKKRFYNILAADIDSNNLQYELVQVIRSTDGSTIEGCNQVFDFSNQNAEPSAE